MNKIKILIIGLFALLVTNNVSAEQPITSIPSSDQMVFWIHKIPKEAGIDYVNSMATITIFGTISYENGNPQYWEHTFYDWPSANLTAVPCPKLIDGYIEITMFGGSAYGYTIYYSQNFSTSEDVYIDVYKSALAVPTN